MPNSPAVVFDWFGTLWTPKGTPDSQPGVSGALSGALGPLYNRGIDFAVISNTTNIGADRWIRKSLDSHGLLKYFSAIVSSADIGIHKPDPAIFHFTARFLHRQPHYILMVGDSLIADGGARHAAWRFRHVETGTADKWIPEIEKWVSEIG